MKPQFLISSKSSEIKMEMNKMIQKYFLVILNGHISKFNTNFITAEILEYFDFRERGGQG